MTASDGADATEVLSLDELRALAAAENEESFVDGPKPRKVKSEDIAEAEASSAPKQWNPQGAAPQTSNPAPWGSEFGAPGHAEGGGEPPRRPQPGPPMYAQPTPGAPDQYGSASSSAGTGHPNSSNHLRNEPHLPNYDPPAYAGNGMPAAAGGAYGSGGGGGFGARGPGGPVGPGGPAGPGGPYRREPETKKVPGWLWVLATIALVAALGIVGYIAWDSMQNNDKTASGSSSTEPSEDGGPQTGGPNTSAPPVAAESFTSPSGNISCTIDSDRARCVISAFDYKAPEKPADCQLENWGGVVVANKEGAGFSCVEAPESSGPARVLGYGESITAEGMTCTSTEEGMTCKSEDSGVGFTMARASVDFLD